MSESNNKMRDSLINNLPLILLATGAVYFVGKILKTAGQTANEMAQALQLKKADEQLQAEKLAKNAIDNYPNEILKKIKPTRPEGFWAQLAERIYEDIRYSAVGDNHEDARFALTYCYNDADFALLYKFYGKRQETWMGIIPSGELKDLIQAINANLNHKQKLFINNNYAQKKMSIRFN